MESVALATPSEGYCEAAYAAHWRDVFRLALAIANDWAAAEDIAQETFVRLWDRQAEMDWSQPVLPWLLRVTRNLANDRFRRLRTALVHQPRRTEALDAAGRDSWIDVRLGLSRLSRTERAALICTSVMGFSSDEVAALLSTTEGAVRAAASRARRKLEIER
jgi:RNA polymerase sigma-70 factor (ECF subfamily)